MKEREFVKRTICAGVLATAIFFPQPAGANTITAASCAQADVRAAVTQSADGDTVIVPAGMATWTNTLTITKGITLSGAGGGQTVITNGGASYTIDFNCTGNIPFRMSKIGLIVPNHQVLNIEGTCMNWRVDHCSFTAAGYEDAVNVWGRTYGVIDHCYFENLRAITTDEDGPGINENPPGSTSWQRPLNPGTSHAVYIENNTFHDNNGILANGVDADGGAREVFRYNTMNSFLEVHGLQNANTEGTFSYEMYNNIFLADVQNDYAAMFLRGGTGVVFDNTVTGQAGYVWQYFAIVRDYRAAGDGSAYWGNCEGANPYDGNQPLTLQWDGMNGLGSHTGANDASTLTDIYNVFVPITIAPHTEQNNDAPGGYYTLYTYVYNLTDGSTAQITAATAHTVSGTLVGGTRNCWNTGDSYKITNGYPCRDQIGRSTNCSLSAVNPQALEPLYAWNNTYYPTAGNQSPAVFFPDYGIASDNHMYEGRDFFSNTPRPDYVPYVYPHPATLGDYTGTRALGLSAKSTGNSVILNWNTVNGAASYTVSKNWATAQTVAVTSFSDAISEKTVYYVKSFDGPNGTGNVLSAEGVLVSSAPTGTAKPTAGPSQPPRVNAINVFPNLDVDKDPTLRVMMGSIATLEITIYNAAGKLVHSITLPGTHTGATANGDQYCDYVWKEAKASGVYNAVIHGKTTDGKVVKARVRFAVVR